ncbi:MAG: hypothetical protein WDN25_02400 [Acetobacteraceae bacterium]
MRLNDSNSANAGRVLLGLVAIALAGMVGTLGLVGRVGDPGPRVGEIIAFDPLEPMARDIRIRLAVTAADDQPGVACVLDVRAMHADGGSVIVEGREPQGRLMRYRVHWAGTRSSDDSADCGASADLLLSLQDVERLAMAAGGYGVPKRTTKLWRAAANAP